MRHGYYRPASRHVLSAGLDEQGRVIAWSHRVIAPSIMHQVFGTPNTTATDPAEGAVGRDLQIPNVRVSWAAFDLPIPLGWWRSVFHVHTCFANESFLDEIAAAVRVDPLEMRRRVIAPGSRLLAVLELAARASGYGKPLPKGHAWGIAAHACFESYCAQVAEVRVGQDGALRKVERVVAAFDCGTLVNPETAVAQIEGGIALGLTAALRGRIRVEKGRVREGNFDDYPPLHIDEMPRVEVHFVRSELPPGGVGEPCVPPIAPAVVNALAAATGKRVRSLPIGA
jgi:CO/xanthine dehydrogenase Mo-binding subunit